MPAFVPLPAYYDPPDYVAYPVDNYFYGVGGGYNRERDVFINNTTIVNNIHQGFPAGGPAAAPGGNGLRNAAIGAALVALPVAAAATVTSLQRRGITTPAQLNAARREPGGLNALRPSGVSTPNNALPGAQRLPGANGRPLPAANATPNAATPNVATPNAAVRPANPARNTVARPAVQTPATNPAAPRRDACSSNVRMPCSKEQDAARQRQDALRQRQDAVRQQQNAQRVQTQQRAVQQRAVQPRAVQPRAVQQRAIQPQRPVPQQVQRAAPPPQQFRPQPQPQQARPGGFGGGGGRPPGFGGGGGRPPGPAAAAARPGPAPGRPAPQRHGPEKRCRNDY